MVGTTLAVALENVIPKNLHFRKIIALEIAALSLSPPDYTCRPLNFGMSRAEITIPATSPPM